MAISPSLIGEKGLRGGVAEWHPRARRFAVNTAIHYRGTETRSWFDGTIENISRTGVSFLANRSLKKGTAVQMFVDLPASKRDGRSGQISCQGHVVRTAPTLTSSLTVVAASIERYRIVRGAS
jgi:hypothetical protein